jgi:quercetin dioxygenase-like cupin family protein
MFIKRLDEATPYEAPNHRGVHGLRLQGFEPGSAETFWVGLSRILPGGGAGPDASPLEKVYVLLSGELTVKIGGKTHVLKALDSCTIPSNEEREILNHTNSVTEMLVVLPYAEKK